MSISAGPQQQYPDEIKLVFEICSEIEKGKSFNSIATDFNDRKIPSPKEGKWTATAIRRIAENPIYAGIVVTGRTRKKMNPFTELPFTEKTPVSEWTWADDPILAQYKIIEPARWINIQKLILKNGGKDSKKIGRPPGAFGNSVLSGMLYCWYCGAPLVSGKGGKKRCFRCSKRRLQKGSQNRCKFSFTLREDDFIPILTQNIKKIILIFINESLRILNEEIAELSAGMHISVQEKKQQHCRLINREATLLELYERAKFDGELKASDSFFQKLINTRNKINDLKNDIENLQNIINLQEHPPVIDEKKLIESIDKISDLSNNPDKQTELRTAIRFLFPKIFIKVDKYTNRKRIIKFRIEGMPKHLLSLFPDTHKIIIEAGKKKSFIDVFKSDINDDDTISRTYDYLSYTYPSDKLSYTFPLCFQVIDSEKVIEVYWNASYRKKSSRIVVFGFKNDELLFGT